MEEISVLVVQWYIPKKECWKESVFS